MKKYKPMLAKTAKEPFSQKNWLFEVKWDGIRAISYVNKELSIKSRNQKELKTVLSMQSLSELIIRRHILNWRNYTGLMTEPNFPKNILLPLTYQMLHYPMKKKK